MRKDKLTGILIDPTTRTITEVEVANYDGRTFLNAMYKLLDCQTIEAVRFDRIKHTLWCDEEGLFKRGNPAFRYEGVGQEMFVGKAIVLADRGEHCADCKLTVEDVTHFVAWTNKVAAL
jgi:hypothetical protein